jgi:uncharacterized protein (DUF2225 family)
MKCKLCGKDFIIYPQWQNIYPRISIDLSVCQECVHNVIEESLREILQKKIKENKNERNKIQGVG